MKRRKRVRVEHYQSVRGTYFETEKKTAGSSGKVFAYLLKVFVILLYPGALIFTHLLSHILEAEGVKVCDGAVNEMCLPE